MKLYMMIVRSYPSIVICDGPPKKDAVGYYFESKINGFGIRESNEPELFNYLTYKFNIPDSDKGFIEVDL